MGLDMGLVATRSKELLDEKYWDDRYKYDEISENSEFYDDYGDFQWPDICEVWYARKFWDMYQSIPDLRKANNNSYVRIDKETLKDMIDFYAYNADYFNGFSGLPRLCELYRDYNHMTTQNIKLYFWVSY